MKREMLLALLGSWRTPLSTLEAGQTVSRTNQSRRGSQVRRSLLWGGASSVTWCERHLAHRINQ